MGSRKYYFFIYRPTFRFRFGTKSDSQHPTEHIVQYPRSGIYFFVLCRDGPFETKRLWFTHSIGIALGLQRFHVASRFGNHDEPTSELFIDLLLVQALTACTLTGNDEVGRRHNIRILYSNTVPSTDTVLYL